MSLLASAVAGPGRALIKAPWQWRRNDGNLWAFRAYLAFWALLCVGPVLAALWWMPGKWATIITSLMAGLAILSWWVVQILALLRLDHPHAARLVPGHQLVLRRSALALWAGAVLLCGVLGMLLALASGSDPWAVLPLALLAAGAVLLAVAVSLRWWWLWFGWWLLPTLGDKLLGRALRQSLVSVVQPLWQAQPVAVTGLLLACMGAVLLLLFGHGDAAHHRAYAQRQRLSRISRLGAVGQQPALAAYGRWGELLGAPSQRLADAWLSRVLARAQGGQANVVDRAELVWHGAQHWVRQLGGTVAIVGLLCLALVVWVSLDPRASDNFFEHSRLGLGIGLFSLLLGPLTALPGALWLSRREQALLALLPGMPQGAALNRALAARQWRHHLLCCALVLPLFVVLALLAGAPQLLALAAVAVAMGPWLWRDVSRQQAPRIGQWLGLWAGAALLGLGSMQGLKLYPAAWGPWLLLLGGLAAALATWRWRRLGRLPQALPAGRLA